jgi:Temperature dependent protein affecting M2 dsRNA replication
MGRSGHSVCLHYQETPQFRALNYLDRFRKAKMAIKHHVVVTREGKVEPFDIIHASGDIHEFIGQRLPEELYFYLSKGIIGPRVLNWRTSGEILEAPPLDNGESDEYRKLVREQLTEMRTSTISLLSFSLHRVYQHRDLNLRCWFDKDKVETITMRNLDDPRPLVSQWHVPESVFGPMRKDFPRSSMLGFAVQLLKDKNFAKRTVSLKKLDQPLVTKNEILMNSIWRLLHIRGYVDNNHNLTSWGVVLNAVMAAVPSRQFDESALIAVELLRLGLLSADYMFPTYSSLGFAASENARRNILLVSRVATLGRLQHKQIGFTGALSRHLLGWHSMISAVRSGLRDLAEVCLTTLLLNGDASRDRSDWTELGLDLPFLLDHGCAMGLAMNIYLNKVVEQPDPKSDEAHQAAKENGQKSVFEHCVDFAGDIDKAMGLWDAVSFIRDPS